MKRRPLCFISREEEMELINRLETMIDTRIITDRTAVVMVSPDYSATVAMHLAHAWSHHGEMVSLFPIDVTYPDEDNYQYRKKFRHDFQMHADKFDNFILIEAGIIRGGNWEWIIEEFARYQFPRESLTLVALCENIHSRVKSDYVAKYYDDEKEELMFYYEKYNKHWPVK